MTRPTDRLRTTLCFRCVHSHRCPSPRATRGMQGPPRPFDRHESGTPRPPLSTPRAPLRSRLAGGDPAPRLPSRLATISAANEPPPLPPRIPPVYSPPPTAIALAPPVLPGPPRLPPRAPEWQPGQSFYFGGSAAPPVVSTRRPTSAPAPNFDRRQPVMWGAPPAPPPSAPPLRTYSGACFCCGSRLQYSRPEFFTCPLCQTVNDLKVVGAPAGA